MTNQNNIADMESLAYQIREHAIHMVHEANASHIGGALSCADILAVLYGSILKGDPDTPDDPGRDRLIFSKGHCCSALYAALAIKGFFSESELASYGQPGSRLMCHASHHVPGVEWSTGSLGHGLGLGCGQALAAVRKNEEWRVYIVMSDGELDEGSNWESFLFAGHHKLGQLTVIIDANGQQGLGRTAEVLDTRSLAEKISSFHWAVDEVDGHDVDALHSILRKPAGDTPRCIVAKTIKGKGVAYMEDSLEWHYKAPVSQELYDKALQQLAECYGK